MDATFDASVSWEFLPRGSSRGPPASSVRLGLPRLSRLDREEGEAAQGSPQVTRGMDSDDDCGDEPFNGLVKVLAVGEHL